MIRKTLTVVALVGLVAVASLAAEPLYGDWEFPHPELLSIDEPVPQHGGIPFSYGTDAWSAYVINPIRFQPYVNGLGYVLHSDGYIGAQGTDTFRHFNASVQLPSGVKVHGLTSNTYDLSDSGYVRLRIFSRHCPENEGCTTTTLFDQQTPTSGTPGYETTYMAYPSPWTWVNYNHTNPGLQTLSVRVTFSHGNTNLRSGPFVIWYQRQISPAPAVATFADVPTGHWAFQHVEALVASGITAGCGGANYCPDSTLTRAQMAVFLAKALGLHWPDA